MKPALGALGILLAVAALAPAAFSQYMYLDTNGDGIHSDADVIAPTGATTLDVWLRTDANRDGTPVTCAWGTEPMTINSYEFILHVDTGTVSWGTFTNQQPSMTVTVPPASSSTEYYVGRGGGVILPAGLYHLCTLTAQVTGGTPSIRIAPSDALRGIDVTAFGCKCPGPDDDNTLVLGSAWFDTDGAAYGGVNHPPLLAQPLDMSLPEGTVADQQVAGSDPDGWTVSFTKAAGPSFMAVTTVSPGPGSGSGRIRLSPGYQDAGAWAGTVQVSDGVLTDAKSFGILVSDVNVPPVLPVIRDVCIEQGQSHTLSIVATDPDGDAVQLSASGIPSFATFVDNGNGTAALAMAPSTTEPLEQSAVTVTASDGQGQTSRSFNIAVRAPIGCFIGTGGYAGGGPAPPIAHAGGPYHSVAGVPLVLNGAASFDPGGAQLDYYWTFGDGSVGLGAHPSHVYDTGGSYRVILEASNRYRVGADTTIADIAEPLQAEALVPEGHTTLRLGSGKPSACVWLKPVRGDFRSADVMLSSVEMISHGTGPAASIPAVSGKSAHLSDWDGDGVMEVEACFRMGDLRLLLGNVPNGAQVEVRIEGDLPNGWRFRAPFSARVLTGGPRMDVAVFPNPFNPSAVLRFETTRAGFARIRLYDLQGKLVRVLLDEPALGAGVHDVRLGTGSKAGGGLASGVYFYRVETLEGTRQGRLVVAK